MDVTEARPISQAGPIDKRLPSLWSAGSNTRTWEAVMKRFVVATLAGLTIAVAISTSASAFQCLARSTNGVNTWGYGIFFSRAAHFAVRHCRVAGGVGCHVAFCR